MLKTSRRTFLAGSAALPVAATARISSSPEAFVAADLEKYIGFGNKQSGGVGDNACGEWLANELVVAGFKVERAKFSAPYFTAEQCEIRVGSISIAVWPQPIVRTTDGYGMTGPLVRVDSAGQADAVLAGAIALVDLPYGRWSSLLAKQIRTPVEQAFAGGAKAVVIITNGPTGKVIALNADGREPMFSGPVGLVAPADAAPLLAGAISHQPATLTITGTPGRREAFNIVGKLDRGKKEWIIVSTPRSGWFGCAGERGGGIAAWLDLARWSPEALPDHNIAFLCNSGHEYEYLGAQEALKAAAPKPNKTRFWLHLGANLAARDWHEGLFGLSPLIGADAQRYLVVSPPLLTTARRLFAGISGLETPYPSDRLSAGELTGIIAAGYPSVAGVFGLHRFHHVIDDDTRCISAEQVTQATAAFRKLLAGGAAA